MKKINLFLILLIPIISFCQEKVILVVDKNTKKPLTGVQIFLKEGSLISSTDNKGQFKLNISKEDNITIVIYKYGYDIIEYSLNSIPNKIELSEKQETLEEVVIKVRVQKKKYFKIKGYARSWQLKNGKLIKYGDALVEYLIPYKESNDDFATGIKDYVIQYRTFKIDSIKDKSRIINISFRDEFFNIRIPNRDVLTRRSYKDYSFKIRKEGVSDIFIDDLPIGYVKFKDSIPIEVSIDNKSKKESIKTSIGVSRFNELVFEKWSNKESKRFVKYLFKYNQKNIKTKLGNNDIETVNEIFITDIVYNSDKKTKKSKKAIDSDRSSYFENYWSKEMEKYPLPSYIKSQLTKVNEKKNKY